LSSRIIITFTGDDTIGPDHSYSYIKALVVFPLQFIFISLSMPIGVHILEGKNLTLGIGHRSMGRAANEHIDEMDNFQHNTSLMPVWAPMTIGSVFLIGKSFINFVNLIMFCIGGVFLSSFVVSNAVLFSIFHGVFFGIGYGLCYMSPILAAYKFYPQNQGWVNGVVMSGFAFGAPMTSGFVYMYVHPWVDPILHIKGGYVYNMCQASISSYRSFNDSFHWLIWTLCLFWAILSIFSLSLMYDREDILEIKKLEIDTNKTQHIKNQGNYHEIMDYEGLRQKGINFGEQLGATMTTQFYRSLYFMEGITDASFIKLFVMMTLSSAYLISLTFLFKPMIERGNVLTNNEEVFPDDEFTGDNWMIILSAVGNFLCGISRVLWGWLADKYGFRSCYTVIVSITIMLIILSLLIHNDHKIHKIYSVFVVCAYILIGGHFAIFPAVFSKIYGNKLGSLLYSISFSAYAISALIAFFLYWISIELNKFE
jgi:MFS family permease